MGRTIREQIGRAPTKFNFGQAIGVAMQGAGQYYGEVALEKRNAEALQASQDFQVERDTAAATTRADEIVASNTRQDSQRKEDADARIAAAALSESNSDSDGSITETLRGDDPRLAGNIGEGDAALDPDKFYNTRFTKDGDVVGVMGEDTDIVLQPDGTRAKLSSGGRGGESTEAQSKYLVHSTVLGDALQEMDDVLAEGFDLDGADGLKAQILSSFGSVGAWFQDPSGQRYLAARNMAGEAMFKGFSGAAGSDAEAKRYYSMLPSPGDKPGTVAAKKRMLAVANDAFKVAAGIPGYEEADIYRYVRSAARVEAREVGFDIDSGMLNGEASAPNPGPSISDEQAARDADLLRRY